MIGVFNVCKYEFGTFPPGATQISETGTGFYSKQNKSPGTENQSVTGPSGSSN